MSPSVRRLSAEAFAPPAAAWPAAVRASRAGLAAVLFAAAALSAETPERGTPAPEAIEGWIEGLGSPEWKVREESLARLVEAGGSAVPALEAAALSDNPERAERARYLLDRLDPEVVRLEIADISGGPRLGIDSAMIFEGRSGEDLRPVEASRPGARVEFSATAVVGPGGRLRLEVEERLQGQQAVPLRASLREPGRAILLRVADRAVFRRIGFEVSRTREIRCALAWAEIARASKLAPAGLAIRDASRVERWAERLVSQARGADPAARAEALEILATLGGREAEGIFGELAGDPRTRSLAEVALGNPEAAREVVSRALSALAGPGIAVPAGPPPRPLGAPWIAALRLLGTPGGPDPREVLRAVPGLGAFEAHLALASLADLAASPGIAPGEARALLSAALSPDVLQACPWDDPETEHFYASILRLADPGDPASGEALRSARLALEALPAALTGRARPGLEAIFGVWFRVARALGRGDPRDAGAFFRTAIATARNVETLSEVASLAEAHVGGIAPGGGGASGDAAGGRGALEGGPGGGPPSEFLGVSEALVRRVEDGDAEFAGIAHQALLRLSQTRRLASGELRPLAEILIRAGVAQARGLEREARTARTAAAGLAPALVRQTRDELVRWSGVAAPAPAAPNPPGPAAAASFDPLPWRRWLEDARAVSERERRLLASAVPTALAGRRYVSYLFDLELGERKEAGGKIPKPRPFRVLDGRRAELAAGQPVALADRWGNAFFLLVEPLGTGSPGAGERVRVNRRGVFALGAPSFFSIDGRPAQVRAYEISDASPGVRALPATPAGSPGLQSVAVFLRAEDDGLSAVEEADPELFWKRFSEEFLLRLEPSAREAQISAALALLSELDVEGRTAFLGRLLDTRPSLDLARAVHAAGDPKGLRAIRGFLSSGDPATRVQAALALSELADPEGPKALLDLLRENPDLERRFAYPALNVLDARLQELRAEDPTRVRILDFVHAALSNPSLQARAFSILRREFGGDFGFERAASIGDAAARRKAVEEAVSRAREAWARTAQGSSR